MTIPFIFGGIFAIIGAIILHYLSLLFLGRGLKHPCTEERLSDQLGRTLMDFVDGLNQRHHS